MTEWTEWLTAVLFCSHRAAGWISNWVDEVDTKSTCITCIISKSSDPSLLVLTIGVSAVTFARRFSLM